MLRYKLGCLVITIFFCKTLLYKEKWVLRWAEECERWKSPTDIPPEFDLGDTVADIQWRRGDREARERDKDTETGEEARREKTAHSPQEGVTEKHARTDKIDTEAGGEAWTSQLNSISGAHHRHLPGGLR